VRGDEARRDPERCSGESCQFSPSSRGASRANTGAAVMLVLVVERASTALRARIV
jgi:hypothetical protein